LEFHFRLSAFNGKRKTEQGSSAFPVVRPDGPAVRLDNAPTNGQSQSDSTGKQEIHIVLSKCAGLYVLFPA
ncbi:MAG TPA: hypothetical protein VFB56_05380, partial [Nitrospiraceae bacterium]|nr:hypothetical protein [Nitrospiraceae bacterium]